MQERKKMNKMFRNPKMRGKWLEFYFGKPNSSLPNYVVDPQSGEQVYDPGRIKDLYLREGTLYLKTFHPRPPDHDEKEYAPARKPPIESKGEEIAPEKPSSLPTWWNKMYNRMAKGIESKVWSERIRLLAMTVCRLT
jgi:hypothetical protein